MAEGQGTEGTAAAAGPTDGATAQEQGISIPSDWSASETFKPYFKEADGKKSFDFETLTRDVVNYRQTSTAVPKTADEYQSAYPTDWVLGQDDVKATKEAAKTAGMTQHQYEAWVKHDIARMERAASEAAADVEKAKQTLGGEWKTDFQKNLGMAKTVAEKFFGKGFSDRADLGNDPAFIRGLYQIGKMMGEDSLKQSGATAGDNRPTGEDGRPRLRFPSMGD